MAKSKDVDVEQVSSDLINRLLAMKERQAERSLRDQVIDFVPIVKGVRILGTALLPRHRSGKERLLVYLRAHVGVIVDGDELMVVAGIGEWARRVRELRVQEGWPIIAGATVMEHRASLIEQGVAEDSLPPPMRADQYKLESDQQDLDAAARWQTTNGIRRSDGAVQDKILKLLRHYVGKPIHSEVLRYVAGEDKSEWARRTRELRTEEGWPVVTKSTGDPSLPVGVYRLVRDEQAPPHDRHIPPQVRGVVMKRDKYGCRWQGCNWPNGYNVQFDPRFLEIHHIQQHQHGGSNTDANNLITLCNVHHDQVHRSGQLLIT